MTVCENNFGYSVEVALNSFRLSVTQMNEDYIVKLGSHPYIDPREPFIACGGQSGYFLRCIRKVKSWLIRISFNKSRLVKMQTNIFD